MESPPSDHSPSSPSSPRVARALELKSPRLKLLLENCRSFAQLKAVHAHMLRANLFADVFCSSHLLAFCADFSSSKSNHQPRFSTFMLLHYAERVFSQVHHPNLFAHNALIRICSRRAPHKSLRLFRLMLRRGIRPDNLTFPFLLTACGAHRDGSLVGIQAHAQIVRAGFAANPFVQSSLLRFYALSDASTAARLFREIDHPDVVTLTAMIQAYCRRGNLVAARDLFDEMLERSTATWSCMICGYAQNGRFQEALDLFRDMRRAAIRANEAAMVGVLASCSGLGALEQGRRAHDYIVQRGNDMRLNVVLGTALVDMYAKCGDLQQAVVVFKGLPASSRDWLTWTTMISALAVHGRARGALELLSEMIESGVSPEEITFTAVLSACSHGGLVEEGLRVFESMKKEHGLEPRMEHYGCVVDLLGRAGRLEEAERLVREMPLKADGSVVGALLGACRIHESSAGGERAGKMLMQLRPDHSGYCVLTAQVCAARDEWRAASEARTRMQIEGVRKMEPGKSILEIDDV